MLSTTLYVPIMFTEVTSKFEVNGMFLLTREGNGLIEYKNKQLFL